MRGGRSDGEVGEVMERWRSDGEVGGVMERWEK